MAISVNLTDPDRVAGFVNPGSEVAIFVTGDLGRGATGADGRGDRPARAPSCSSQRVTVLGVGSTTPVTTTTTAEDGTQQTEQLPRTLLTLALSQEEAQKVILASKTFDADLRAADQGQHGRRTVPRPPAPTSCPDADR